jgi:predicted RNA-binding Zn ribbon-like protein
VEDRAIGLVGNAAQAGIAEDGPNLLLAQIGMDEIRSEAETHRLIGGALCLDFANTLNGHGKPAGHEYLKAYRDLAVWCRRVDILTDRDAESLIGEAARQPAPAAAAFERAIALRETIYRIFSAIAHGAPPGAADLAALNEARSEALAHSQIVPTAGGFALDWTDKAALEWVLWPIALSAADLLTSGNRSHVRACAGQGCDWLFLDTSRNHSRRWCTMDGCGNRSKARRFYERKRG